MTPVAPIDVFGMPLWQVQLIISVLGLIIGSVIATAGSIIAYRNVYGAAPIYLVSSWGIGVNAEEEPENFFVLSMTIEFWNRRKYPIVLNGGVVTFPGLKFKMVYRYLESPNKLTISSDKNSCLYMNFRSGNSVKLDPGMHYSFKINFPFEKPKTRVEIDTMAKLALYYFDPASNKRKRLHGRHRYNFKAKELPDVFPEDLLPATHDEVHIA